MVWTSGSSRGAQGQELGVAHGLYHLDVNCLTLVSHLDPWGQYYTVTALGLPQKPA